MLAGAHSMLLGRVTYDGFAEHAGWNNSTIVADDIPGRARALRGRENVIVWGSPTLVKTLMAEHLVDEYLMLVAPIVLGHGRKMLHEDGTRHALRIVEQRLLDGGMLALRMTPAAA